MIILFASLALTKMNCNRIANYFLLPVFFSLAYINLAHQHYYKAETLIKKSSPKRSDHEQDRFRDSIVSDENNNSNSNNSSSIPLTLPISIVDTIEFTLTNGLGLILLAQLTVNLLAKKQLLSKSRTKESLLLSR